MNAILILIGTPLVLLWAINTIQRIIKRKIDKDNALVEERQKVADQIQKLVGTLADIFTETLKNQKFTSNEITNIKLCYVASVQKALNKVKEL